jgi:hypothetical protein
MWWGTLLLLLTKQFWYDSLTLLVGSQNALHLLPVAYRLWSLKGQAQCMSGCIASFVIHLLKSEHLCKVVTVIQAREVYLDKTVYNKTDTIKESRCTNDKSKCKILWNKNMNSSIVNSTFVVFTITSVMGTTHDTGCSPYLALLWGLLLSCKPRFHEGTGVALVDHVAAPQSWMYLLCLESPVCPHGGNSRDESTTPQLSRYPPVTDSNSVINNIWINKYLNQHLLYVNLLQIQNLGTFA